MLNNEKILENFIVAISGSYLAQQRDLFMLIPFPLLLLHFSFVLSSFHRVFSHAHGNKSAERVSYF